MTSASTRSRRNRRIGTTNAIQRVKLTVHSLVRIFQKHKHSQPYRLAETKLAHLKPNESSLPDVGKELPNFVAGAALVVQPFAARQCWKGICSNIVFVMLVILVILVRSSLISFNSASLMQEDIHTGEPMTRHANGEAALPATLRDSKPSEKTYLKTKLPNKLLELSNCTH